MIISTWHFFVNIVYKIIIIIIVFWPTLTILVLCFINWKKRKIAKIGIHLAVLLIIQVGWIYLLLWLIVHAFENFWSYML